MNNDTALVLLLADRQREIEALRADVARLTAERDDLLHRPDHAHDPVADQGSQEGPKA